MNDVAFFAQNVLPAIEEVSRNPGNVRMGTQACQWLQNMSDHYFRHNKNDSYKVHNCTQPRQFRAILGNQDWATKQIMAIANGTKHANKYFDNLHHERPSVCGVMRAGFPVSSEPYVFIDEDNAWLLYQLTEYVAGLWKTRLGLSQP